MTDDELKALVASLAVSQKLTDEQLRQTDAQIKETDAQIKETDAQLKQTAAQLKKTDAQLKQTATQLKQTDAQLRRTDQKLERIGITVGNIGQNQGAVAEEFFYNSLKDTQTLAGIHYDFIDKNISRTHNGITDEYDMILINGQDVAIIEVKYKAHEADLTKLLTKKYANFKSLFSAYKDYRHHLVLATFHLYDDLKEKALENNVIVLQRKGDMVQSYLPR